MQGSGDVGNVFCRMAKHCEAPYKPAAGRLNGGAPIKETKSKNLN